MLCIILNCSTRSLVSLVTWNPVSNTSSSIWRPGNFLCQKFTQQGFLCLNNTRHFLIAAVSRWEILKSPSFGTTRGRSISGLTQISACSRHLCGMALRSTLCCSTRPGHGPTLARSCSTVMKTPSINKSFISVISFSIQFLMNSTLFLYLTFSLFQITSFMLTSISFPFILFKAWQLWSQTYKACCQNFDLIISRPLKSLGWTLDLNTDRFEPNML